MEDTAFLKFWAALQESIPDMKITFGPARDAWMAARKEAQRSQVLLDHILAKEAA